VIIPDISPTCGLTALYPRSIATTLGLLLYFRFGLLRFFFGFTPNGGKPKANVLSFVKILSSTLSKKYLLPSVIKKSLRLPSLLLLLPLSKKSKTEGGGPLRLLGGCLGREGIPLGIELLNPETIELPVFFKMLEEIP